MKVGTGFGQRCPKCGTTIDVFATVGGDPSKCPSCGTTMVPNPAASITANAYCRKCNSLAGITNSDRCPQCGELYST